MSTTSRAPTHPAAPQQGAPAAATRPNEAVCWGLPESGAALPLGPGDIEAAAQRLNVDTPAVYAVTEVEAHGAGFDAQKRPKILFEPARFHDYTHHRFDASHPELSCTYSSPRRRASYRKDQWDVLHAAFLLDPDNAVKATSWGMFQVLGANMGAGGYTDTRTFVDAMFASEGNHLRLFVDLLRVNRWDRYLRAHQWASFASHYNGPGYRDDPGGAYDVRL
ncbi:MAG TPA: N-acetylmuramidase domain-containing protein, partial [Minicystis sp.]|nr:N-acetylmuramidase domain-containing protein [Minicystis sp.]